MTEGGQIFELSHESRRGIIESVIGEPKRHTELVKILDISPAETTRHLNRLIESKFIEKTPELTYKPTSFGKVLYQQLKDLTYLSNNIDFFEKHDLSVIPDEFFSLPVISTAKIIKGTLKVMDAIYDITANSRIFLWSTSQEPIEPFIMENVHKLSIGVELRLMYQEGAALPSDYLSDNVFPLELRSLNDVKLSIWLNEVKAILILPDLDGKIDYSFALISEKESFLRWCSLLFENYWDIGRPVVL